MFYRNLSSIGLLVWSNQIFMVPSVWRLGALTCSCLTFQRIMQVGYIFFCYFKLFFKIATLNLLFEPIFAVWMGKIYDCAHYKKKYGVDHVHFVEDVTNSVVLNIMVLIYNHCFIILIDDKCLGNSQSPSHLNFGNHITLNFNVFPIWLSKLL